MDRLHDRFSGRRYHSGGSGIVIGGLIVVIGLLILLDNLGIVRVHDVWRYWPLLLIVFGISKVLGACRPAGYLWGGAIVLIGALLLLDNLDIVVFNYELIWPLVLIAFGLSMLLRAMDRRRTFDGATVSVSTEPVLEIVAVFSGTRRTIDTKDFRGGEIVAVFGGVRLDLRQAMIAVDHADLEINAVFGGVEIQVPETWNVQCKGAGVFGGFDDKTIHPRPDPGVKTPLLVITGAAVFGGLSVTN
jgi:predicted membrane protein